MERWDQEQVISAKGIPARPILGGRNDIEVQSHSQHREAEEEIMLVPSIREHILGRMYVQKVIYHGSHMESLQVVKAAKPPFDAAWQAIMNYIGKA